MPENEVTGADAWDAIQKVCRKTVEDLNIILRKLEDLQNNELNVNQKKQIKEWYKGDIFPDRSLLLKYPSIIKYIAGYRQGEEVVKVYLSGDDEEAKLFFRTQCKVSKNAIFEFVNVEQLKATEEEKEIENLEIKFSADEDTTKKELMQIIRKNGKKMFARYSNIIGIRLGQTKQSNIILYCLDRTIIPFGEHSLPESIAGKPCDLIENFIILGKCPSYCSEEIPEYGCSIGIPSKQGAGSVGFFYETDNSKFGSGFITAAHVAIESCYESRYQNRLLSNCSLRRQGQRITHSIVHPKCRNDEGNEHIVGQVVESFYGEYKLSSTLTEGLDFAAVKTNCCRHGKKETLQLVEREKLGNREMVTKTGKTTGKTFGYLIQDVMYASFLNPQSGRMCILPELYMVKNMNEQDIFFDSGDSGSGVFVVREKPPEIPLGIGIGISTHGHYTIVCKIDKVIENLGLTLVSYTDDKQSHTSTMSENSLKDNISKNCDRCQES